jgi:hypothetical protein
VAGDEVVDLGTVVVGAVVVGVVVVGSVVVGSVTAVEPDADAAEEVVVGVVDVVVGDVDVVVGSAPADEEWVTVSEATRTPSPAAPAAAATPMAAVARRTRFMARSRSWAACPGRGLVVRGGRAMVFLSSRGRRAGPAKGNPIHVHRRTHWTRTNRVPPPSRL